MYTVVARKVKQGAWVRILCKKTGRVLVGLRTDGSWNYFGGNVDEDEPALDAVVRELYEETGLKFKAKKFKKIVKLREKNTNRKMSLFLLKVDEEISPPNLDPSEHTEFRWVKPKKFRKFKVNRPTKILRVI